MVRWLLGAALGLTTPAASAQTMTVEVFLGKAINLKNKGVFALMSSDLPPVKAEIKAVATEYRRHLRLDREAGRPPHSCPPPEGSKAASIKPAVFLEELERIPAQQRQMPMRAAFFQIMKRRWPCPA